MKTSVNPETIEEVRILREENKLNIINDDLNDSLSEEDIDHYIKKAIKSTSEENGWSDLAALGLYLVRHTPINYRNYGYNSLRRFIESRDLFETKVLQKSPNARNVDTAFVKVKLEN